MSRTIRDQTPTPPPDRPRAGGVRLGRAALRVPLFYKILIANAVIVVLGAVAGTAITLHYLRSGGSGFSAPGLTALFALAGVGVTLLVNALILRLALRPLQLLEATARRVQAGDLDARVSPSAVADRELERLTGTFNGMLENLQGYGQQLRETAARALRAEEEERKRISRELHDDTAQTLAALLVRLRLLRGQQDPERREAMLDQLRTEIGDALERVRRFAQGLRPPALEELGLIPALESHLRMVEEGSAVEIRFEATLPDRQLGPAAELALYRIAQEAVSNAVRHAGARTVTVRLRPLAEGVGLEVLDDGRGFDLRQVREAGGGLGLFGMEERALYVGGAVEIDAAPGRGTRVQAHIAG